MKASDAPDISIRDTARTLSETSRFEPFFLLPVHSVKARLHTSHEDSSKSLQSIEAKVSGITAVPTLLGACSFTMLQQKQLSGRGFVHSFFLHPVTNFLERVLRKERKRSNRLYEAMFQKSETNVAIKFQQIPTKILSSRISVCTFQSHWSYVTSQR